jgi:plastocyanin
MKQLVLSLLTVLLATTLHSGTTYQETNITNGGIIQGKVLWRSTRPSPQVVPVAKDHKICGDSKIIPCTAIGKNGEVPNAVVYLDGITSGKKRASATKVQLDQKNCEYVPHVLVVPPNAEVEIVNSDATLHNVHTYNMAGERPSTIFNLAFPFQGHRVTRKITEAGKILSLCDAGHPWMSAHVLIANHPYYAVTDAAGNFSMDGVPPGKYTLRLWHEGIPKLENNSNTAFLKTQPRETSKQVSVSSKQTITVDFEL